MTLYNNLPPSGPAGSHPAGQPAGRPEEPPLDGRWYAGGLRVPSPRSFFPQSTVTLTRTNHPMGSQAIRDLRSGAAVAKRAHPIRPADRGATCAADHGDLRDARASTAPRSFETGPPDHAEKWVPPLTESPPPPCAVPLSVGWPRQSGTVAGYAYAAPSNRRRGHA